MARHKKSKRETVEYRDAELNIMPFIDVFSVLNTFLLFSAVFVAFGVVKVQIPYFTNKQDNDKPKRTMTVKVEIEKTKATLISAFSMAPINEDKQVFNLDPAGLTAMHQKAVQIRQQNSDTDLITAYAEDDVVYEDLIKVLDVVKLRRDNDPEFKVTASEDDKESELKQFVFPKIVMGSVVL